jgi:histidine triad (HIT) family protein
MLPQAVLASLLEVEDPILIGNLIITARRLAQEKGFVETLGAQRGSYGFRVIINTWPGGGQPVYHLHVHLLGGRFLPWSPG